MCMYMPTYTCPQGSVISFHCMVSRDWTHVKLGSKRPYPPSHGPWINILWEGWDSQHEKSSYSWLASKASCPWGCVSQPTQRQKVPGFLLSHSPSLCSSFAPFVHPCPLTMFPSLDCCPGTRNKTGGPWLHIIYYGRMFSVQISIPLRDVNPGFTHCASGVSIVFWLHWVP